MSNLPSISFENISFGFENKLVLEHFSFVAQKGKHTVLKGESGSGKSTIIKLLLGFYSPLSGNISVNQDGWNPQTIRKQTAWLPQDLNIGTGTVKEVMAKPFRFDQNNAHKKADKTQKEILQQLGMEPEVFDKQFRDLSTGQRQRIGIATCYLLDKPLLLLDEPTAALDQASKQKVANLLLNSEKTIISTSHDPFWVEYADKIIDIP